MTESRPGRYLVALWLLVVGMWHLQGLSRLVGLTRSPSPGRQGFSVYVPYIFLVFLIYLIVGLIRYKPFPTALSLMLICTWPVVIVANFISTGYFSAWVATAFVVITAFTSACGWYLLRRNYRRLWDPRLSQGTPPAAAS